MGAKQKNLNIIKTSNASSLKATLENVCVSGKLMYALCCAVAVYNKAVCFFICIVGLLVHRCTKTS